MCSPLCEMTGIGGSQFFISVLKVNGGGWVNSVSWGAVKEERLLLAVFQWEDAEKCQAGDRVKGFSTPCVFLKQQM